MVLVSHTDLLAAGCFLQIAEIYYKSSFHVLDCPPLVNKGFNFIVGLYRMHVLTFSISVEGFIFNSTGIPWQVLLK